MRTSRQQTNSDDDVMKHGVILQILIALVISIASAYAITTAQLARVDTREQTRAEETERAIERINGDAERRDADIHRRIDREMSSTNEKLDKIDANVQWLIKQQFKP